MLERQTEEAEYSPKARREMYEMDEAERQYQHEIETRFARHGFVGFIDLLGYSQIAATDDTETIAKVMNLMQRAKENAIERLREKDYTDFGQPASAFTGSFYDDIQTTFISDSIIIHRDSPEETVLGAFPGDAELAWAWELYWFLNFICEIYTSLLLAELPCRGGVSYGRFFWNLETLLAGSAFIEAHRESESIHVPAIIMGDSVNDRLAASLARFSRGSPLPEVLAHGIELKRKDGTKTTATVIRPSLDWSRVGDVDAFVHRQFTSYGKKTDAKKVQLKMRHSKAFFAKLSNTPP